MGNENDRNHVEELLSGYIDGQLSKRQKMEIKRLLVHDSALAEELEQLSRQKKLLNSLPIASAPVNLLDDIKASLERKLILDDYSLETDEVAGAKHLFFCRALTGAAMFALIGLLGYVVFNIVKPAPTSIEPVVMRNVWRKALDSQLPDAVSNVDEFTKADQSKEHAFTITLDLGSYSSIAANNYIEKAVFDNNLWVLEGWNEGNRNDVWCSSDGVEWRELPGTPWPPRHAASLFVFDDALWVVAGNNMESDVWKLVRGTGNE